MKNHTSVFFVLSVDSPGKELTQCRNRKLKYYSTMFSGFWFLANLNMATSMKLFGTEYKSSKLVMKLQKKSNSKNSLTHRKAD